MHLLVLWLRAGAFDASGILPPCVALRLAFVVGVVCYEGYTKEGSEHVDNTMPTQKRICGEQQGRRVGREWRHRRGEARGRQHLSRLHRKESRISR